jgi:hypothetical protein
MKEESAIKVIKYALKEFIDRYSGDPEKQDIILDINKCLCGRLHASWEYREVNERGEVSKYYIARKKMSERETADQLENLMEYIASDLNSPHFNKVEIDKEDLDALYNAVAILRGLEE